MKTLWEIAYKNKIPALLLYGIHSISEYGEKPNTFFEFFERALSSLSRQRFISNGIDRAFYFFYTRFMLTIRLQRVGRKNDPNFRVVLIESKRAPKSGAFLENLGSYNPKTKKTQLDSERIKYWLEKGVVMSPTAHNMFVSNKIIEAAKINVVKIPKTKEVLTPSLASEAGLTKKVEGV